MDIIVTIFIAVLFFAIGWNTRERYAHYVLNKVLSKVQEHVEEKDDSLIPISIEVHNDTFFVYNLEDKSFMAQGSSRKELEANLIARYPDKHFAATTENLKAVGFAK